MSAVHPKTGCTDAAAHEAGAYHTTPFVPQPLTELPPLPEPAGKLYSYNYTADQMRAYGRAVEAEVLKRMEGRK